MPKKTRQEKVVAQLRRLQNLQNTQAPKETNTVGQTVNLKDISLATQTVQPKTPVTNYSYVFTDLKKTTVFAIVAIIFEIVLSLTASGLYANLISRLF